MAIIFFVQPFKRVLNGYFSVIMTAMEIFVKHPHWLGAVEVCETLQKAGFVAWLAGGCVRDGLMNRTPRDFDVATDALPEQVETLFDRSIPVGKEFGVIVIPFKNQLENYQIEVATFRRDGAYGDGRRPETVEYSSSQEDACRRDFTINGMFYDMISRKVVDYVEGREDIEGRQLRAIGDPRKRFSEDKLRMLRAVRFIGELGFNLCEETKLALKECAADLKEVSDERKRDELLKLLKSPERQTALDLLFETGLLKVLFKEYINDKIGWSDLKRFFAYYEGGESEDLLWVLWLFPWSRTLGVMGELRDRKWVVSDKVRKKIEKRVEVLKLSRQQSQRVVYVITHFDTWFLRDELRKGWKVRIFANGEKGALLRELIRRFELAEGCLDIELCELEENLVRAGANLDKGTLPESMVDGQWLKEKGIKSGKKMGEYLEELYLLQLEELIYSQSDAEKWLDRELSKLEPKI